MRISYKLEIKSDVVIARREELTCHALAVEDQQMDKNLIFAYLQSATIVQLCFNIVTVHMVVESIII